MIAATLLLPIAAQAQSYPQPSYGPNVVIVPPAYPNSGDSTGGGFNIPFQPPQVGQQRLLEMLETGGVEQPPRRTTPQGCVYSGHRRRRCCTQAAARQAARRSASPVVMPNLP